MNNERAFPWCGDLNETPTINLGMTLRDYFAAKAMQGLIASGDWETATNFFSEWAYEMADSMLEARK